MTRSWNAGRAAALALAVTLGCREAPTQIVVHVDSLDLREGRDLSAVEVAARWEGGDPLGPPRRVDLLDGGYRFPGEVRVTPPDPTDPRRVLVTVVATLTPSGEPLSQEFIVRFERGRTKIIYFRLSAFCQGVSCGDGRTCVPAATGAACADRERPIVAEYGAGRPDALVWDDAVAADGAGDAASMADASDVAADQTDAATDAPADQADAANDAPTDQERDAADGGAADARDVALADVGDAPLDAPIAADVVACGDGGALCGDACVQLNTRAHCGACDRQCVATCRDGGCNDPVEVSAGDFISCARLANGEVWCWGSNSSFALGMADARIISPLPVRVGDIVGAQQVAVGASGACARMGDRVLCWGRGDGGQLGNGSFSMNSATPLQVRTLPSSPGGIAEICSSADVRCARLSSGALHCWGSGNTQGFAGPGMAMPSELPPTGVSRLFCGTLASFALVSSGSPLAWGGTNGACLLGDMSMVRRPEPAAASTLAPFVQFSAGALHVCAVRQDTRAVYCWGRNYNGALGVAGADTPCTHGPAVAGLGRVAEVGVNNTGTSCARLEDGAVWCWGTNESGQLGRGGGSDPDGHPTPMVVLGLERGVRQLSMGTRHVCVLRDDASIWCWGYNGNGEAGTPIVAYTSSARPVRWP